MIVDATIKLVAEECGLGSYVLDDFVWFNDWDGTTGKVLPEFARAIEQLARQEQRKNIRSVTQYGDFEVRIVFSSVRSASEFRLALDCASGKENSNE